MLKKLLISSLVAITIFLFCFAIFNLEIKKIYESESSKIHDIAASYAVSISNNLNSSLSTTYTLSLFVKVNKIDEYFDIVSSNIIRDYPGISALAVMPDAITTKIYPLKGNEAAVGHNLLKDPARRNEILSAIKAKSLAIGGPYPLKQGGIGIIARLPIFINNKFWGLTAAVINFDEFMTDIKIDALAKNYYVKLYRFNPASNKIDIFYNTFPKESKGSTFDIDIPNSKWYLVIAPKYFLDSRIAYFLGIALFSLLSISLGFIVFQFLNYPQILEKEIADKSRDLINTNQSLVSEIKERIKKETELIEIKNNLDKIVKERTLELEIKSHNIENLNLELKKVLATKDRFFSIIAHDLRGPIGNLAVMVDLINKQHKNVSESDKKEIMIELAKSLKKTYDLTDNLLLWATNQQGIMTFSPEKILLNELIANTVSLLEPIAKIKEISIIYNSSNCPCFVNSDKNMITTVIRNLISNAIKFTNSGGSVTIEVALKDIFAEISISDTGIGIEEERLNKLFALGESVRTDGTNGERGSGLGLILCKDFVEKNGGKIFVESIPNKGTKFSFTIPIL